VIAPPVPTALYRICGEADALLYIGVTDDLPVRWNSHALKQPWWSELRSLTLELFDSREAAEAAETTAIKTEKPKYNKKHAEKPAQPSGSRAVPGGVRARRPAAFRQREFSMSMEELRAMPVYVDLETAGRAFGFGRTKAHELTRAGEFPCEVKRFGNRYRVLRADLLTALGYSPASAAPDPSSSPAGDRERRGEAA